MDSPDHQPTTLTVPLTLEDDFVLSRIRTKAKELTSRTERDQYMWSTIYKLMCINRAYKTVLHNFDTQIVVNVALLDDKGESTVNN